MGLYEELLAELKGVSDSGYAAFQSRLLNNPDICVLGVRTPVLRSLAKKYSPHFNELFTLPDEYYEVTFLKLITASHLPYDEFIKVVDGCVEIIDNWATCDCFKADCIKRHKAEFLPFVKAYLGVNREFYQRYALVTLLHFYVEEEYLNLIFESVEGADTNYYYVHMAAAWLIAEVLIKHYDKGVEYLKADRLDKKTHNKAIAKACESFRLTQEQKRELKGLRRP
ncbi:MAG: DNA alkylation repair protein [Candidatus Coproplasma sp.]